MNSDMELEENVEKGQGEEIKFSNVEVNNLVVPEENDGEKLRGDAIGSTLYSESGLLKTLINLSKLSDDSWSEQLEEQLCLLWDMTFEEDVIVVLMKHDFITLACHIIRSSSEPRLIEILVGIIGNMTALYDVRLFLSQSGTVQHLFSLFSSSDAPTLLQLVRLFNSCVWYVNKSSHATSTQDEDAHADTQAEVESWMGILKESATALNEHLSFILLSSTNEDLLQSSLELLNNLCCVSSKSHYFSEFLSTTELLRGLAEALQQMLWGNPENDSDTDPTSALWGEKAEKAAQHWSQTISAFTLHDPGIEVLYDQRQNIMHSICSILDPLGLKENIYPVDSRKLEIVDSIIDVLEGLQRKRGYAPPAILPRLLTLLTLLYPVNGLSRGEELSFIQDFKEENELEKCVEINRRIYDYCVTALCDIETSVFLEAFGIDPVPKVKTLLSNFSKCSGFDIQKIVNIIQKHVI